LERKCILHGNDPFSSILVEFVERQVTLLEVGEAHEVDETNYKAQIDKLETQITRMIKFLNQHSGIEGVARIRERLVDELTKLETDRIQLSELEETLFPGSHMRANTFRILVKDIQRIKNYVRFKINPQLRELRIPVDDIDGILIT